MGKVAQQLDLVRKEPVNLHFGATPLSAVANIPAAHKAGRALLRPQLPGLSSTLRTIIDNVPFIADIECDAQSSALVQAIIGIGKSLNVAMVAEGVETQGQATLLEIMCCDYLQGFLIGRPVSAAAL